MAGLNIAAQRLRPIAKPPQQPVVKQATPVQPVKPMGLGVGPLKPGQPGFTGYKDDVHDIAASYMSKDSRLMQGAAARGAAFANSRGMLNSSLGAQSGEAAALEQVVPMASQTAGQNFQKNMSGIRYREGSVQQEADRNLQRELQAGRISFEATQADYDRRFKERLQSGQIAHEAAQAAKDRVLKREAMRTDTNLQRQKMGMDWRQGAMERGLRERLAKLDVKSNDRRGVEAMLNNAWRDYESAQQSILTNEKIPAVERNKLLANARDMLERKMDFTQKLYGTTYSAWPKNPFASFAPPGAKPAPKNPGRAPAPPPGRTGRTSPSRPEERESE